MIHEHDIKENIVKANLPESQTIASALDRLKAIHPVEVISLLHEVKERNGLRWDGELTFKTPSGTFHYVFEVKNNLRPQIIKHLLVQANLYRNLGKGKKLLLIADYVNPSLGNQLKAAGIDFIDAVGNLFLQRGPGLYLYIEGKKPSVFTQEKPSRLFQPSGLAMLLGLLIDPESVNQPYRRLAEMNGVALGTVGWVMRDLREHGYLEPISKKRFHLIRRKELLERWVQGYASRLRPKALKGMFNDLSKDLDQALEAFQSYAGVQQIRWGLTGGFGADELVHHYRGMTLTIFVERWSLDSLVALEWIPVEEGPITVLKQFSPRVLESEEHRGHYPVVHPLLVYAELLYKGTDRELETARLIHTKFLEQYIAKD